MTAPRHAAGALAAALGQRAAPLGLKLLPAGHREGRDWCVGSLAGEPGSSLALCLHGPNAGRWIDHATDQKGDALGLVAAVLFRGRVRDAMDWSRAWLGLAHGAVPEPCRLPAPDPQQEDARDTAEAAARAREAWRTALPLPGTPAATYLASRALPDLEGCPMLRWHPSASHPSGARCPAMLALVQDVDGGPMGIHRTHLTAAGQRPPGLPRASLGRVKSGAVRLEPAAPELVIGEGIETSASAGLILGLPAWAALSTSGLRSLRLPDEVRRVTIAADHDDNGAGQAAAEAARERWQAEGRSVRVVLPETPGQDFNDILQDRARRAAGAAHG